MGYGWTDGRTYLPFDSRGIVGWLNFGRPNVITSIFDCYKAGYTANRKSLAVGQVQ